MVCQQLCAGLRRVAPHRPHLWRGCCLQEVAETMEKQGLKEEAIEFYTQVRTHS